MDIDVTINDISENVSAMMFRIEFVSCMFDLVSTISNVFLTRSSWREVIRTQIGLYCGLIISDSTISIVVWLSSYILDGGPMV